ncbi:MAG: YebC/PmpR family DNA-binding transcriptional regulator [Planctomycetota bacterium]
MAGHSKWANIKHRKARVDAAKGRIWSKCSKAIIAAARNGGGDPDTNLTLRYAIDEARYQNMPKDNIQRAIEKGAGAGQGDNYEEVTYEGYGPAGVAMIVLTLTDNNTRTVNDVRSIFKKHGGNMGQTGCVAFGFDTKGRIIVNGAAGLDEDKMMEVALEAGAEDVEAPDGATDDEPGVWTVLADPTEFQQVKVAIEAAGLTIAEAEIARIPQQTVEVRGDDVRKLINLVDALEDNDDVQKVFSNSVIPDDELAALG